MKALIDPEKPNPRGYATTEFWLTLAAVVVSALAASNLFEADSVAMKVIGVAGAVLAALGYTVGRSYLKGKGQ